MANKTNTITNAQAIERAIAALNNLGSTDQELIEKLEHMHKMATKKRPSSESPEAKETRTVLMPATLEFMRKKGEPVSWRDIAENVRGITTSQKVSAVMKKLIASGEVTKEYDGRATIYRLAEQRSGGDEISPAYYSPKRIIPRCRQQSCGGFFVPMKKFTVVNFPRSGEILA